MFQGSARLSQATHDFLEQYGHTNAAPPGSIEAILHSYVVIGDHACDLNPFSLGQLSCHLEVQHVTGVVLDDVEHAGTAIDGACRGKHLIWHRRGKDGTRASRIEHTMTDKTTVHRFMTTATARDHTYFATDRSILARDHLVLVIDTDQFRVQGLHASECLFYHVLWPVNEFLHVCLLFESRSIFDFLDERSTSGDVRQRSQRHHRVRGHLLSHVRVR